MFGKSSAADAAKHLDDITTRAAKVVARLERARADLAAIDAEPIDADDESELTRAAKKRREASDLVSALEGQSQALASQHATAEDAAARAAEDDAAERLEVLRAQLEREDAATAQILGDALQRARARAATVDLLVRQAEAARAALPAERRGRSIRARFDSAAVTDLASQVTP